MADLVALGEMMLRLEPPGHQRLQRATLLAVRPCGAQFNVAADYAALGGHSVFLTRVPTNETGALAVALGRSFGVDMSYVRRIDGARMGLVFVEFGADPRGHTHIYDRGHSAASLLQPDDFAWEQVLKGARLAYVDGIVPGLGDGPRETTLRFIEEAKRAGCRICFDVNYRETIWTPEQARSIYRRVLPQVDILVTNRNTAERVLDFRGDDEVLLRGHAEAFGCETICLTYREMTSQRWGAWRSMALHKNQITHGRRFEFEVIDRFGTGDAFFAGFLFEMMRSQDIQHALDFGNALCALAHTVEGDQAVFSYEEVETLLNSDHPTALTR